MKKLLFTAIIAAVLLSGCSQTATNTLTVDVIGDVTVRDGSIYAVDLYTAVTVFSLDGVQLGNYECVEYTSMPIDTTTKEVLFEIDEEYSTVIIECIGSRHDKAGLSWANLERVDTVALVGDLRIGWGE